MTAQSGPSVALIIDHDLGFLMWLGEVCAELECRSLPALHCRQAVAMARRLQLPVTILFLNPELRGAARTVNLLAAANPGLRVILIRDKVDGLSAVPTDLGAIVAQGTLERPSPWEQISRPEWVAKLRKLLSMAAGT